MNYDLVNAFNAACDWLEKESESHSVPEFAAKMGENTNKKVYARAHIVILLKNKYRDHLIITGSCSGKEEISFRNTAQCLINEKFKKVKDDIKGDIKDTQKWMISVVKGTRLKLNLERCQEVTTTLTQSNFLLKDIYAWLPDSLRVLLDILISSAIKKTSIRHSIVTTCCKHIISPLLFGLGIHLQHSFGFKWLNNQSFRFGFSITGEEARRFKQYVIWQGETISDIVQDSFV